MFDVVEAIRQLAARVRHLETVELLHNAIQIRGVDVQNTAPSDGDVLQYDATDARWEPTAIVHDAVKIRGVDVSTTSPSSGSILRHDGTKWAIQTLAQTDIKVGIVRCSSDLTLTNTYQDVPGCSVTVTTGSGEVIIVLCLFDFEMQYTSNTNDLLGTLNTDGTASSNRAAFEGDAPGERGVVSQIYILKPSAGNHTFKMQARRTTTGTGDYLRANGTAMLWLRTKLFTDESP